jgi:hypothetical protein
MLVEVPLIQRFSLLLGNPAHSLSVVLAALLVFSGLGSLVAQAHSSRGGSPRARLLVVLAAAAAAALLLAAALPRAWPLFAGGSVAGRATLACLMIAPAGLLMGMPFPMGLRLLGGDPGRAAWAWGVNGCLSVAGSVLAVLLAMASGLSAAMQAGAAAYLAALLLSIRSADAR